MYTIGSGQTQNFDNIGTSTINFQTVTNTVTVNGTNYTYTTLEKINPALDWVVTSSGLNSYTRYEEFTDTITPFINGGVISNEGTVNISNAIFRDNLNSGSITSTFSVGSGPGHELNVQGGAIYNGPDGEMNLNNVIFINNGVTANAINAGGYAAASTYGGAVFNEGRLGSIAANFIGNYAAGGGGAISNGSNSIFETGFIDSINANFINNYADGGGAIYNGYEASIGNITGNFIGNYANGGGAIFNYASTISNVTANFIGNYATYYGGAIHSTTSTINNVMANFINNYVVNNDGYAQGGAIYNEGTYIGEINGNFINNYATTALSNTYVQASGGAIANISAGAGFIANITGNFIENYASGAGNAYGGAIYQYDSSIGNITGNFINNYASGAGNARGGAIYNGEIGYISGDINGSFIGNYAQTSSTSQLALGGAIYDIWHALAFKADGTNNFFTGNYTQDPTRGKIANAIFFDTTHSWMGTPLTFDITNNGNFIFDDMIEAGQVYWMEPTTIDYSVQADLKLTGDGTGKFFMRNNLINIGEVSVEDSMLIFAEGPYGKGRFIPDGSLITPMSGNNSVTSLSLTNGQFYIYNNYFETVNLVNYTSAGNSFLHIEVGKDGGVWTSDMLNISGDINGQTKVVVYALTPDTDLTSVVFVDAPNDTIENRYAFEVFRTYGSPFVWEAHWNLLGTETGSVWYLTQTNEENEFTELPDPIQPPTLITPDPDPDPEVEVNPEVMAYRGLQIAALEQTRSMVYNVRNKVAANKILPNPCANVIDEYMGRNVWVNPIYFNSTTKRPVEIDANIWGLEAGFDVQRDINHKLGIFVSYRKGDYDLSGKGKVYYSDIGSSIDIDSYIAGLYYRYDYRHLWAFATLYGGIQQADIKTKDGVKADTDGKQFGGSVEVGYTGAIKQDLSIEPSIGLSYTQVDFDNIKDTFGKTARYSTISQWELEAGVKLEQQLNLANGTAKVYVKPSVIQPITGGDNVTITGLGKMSAYDDNTLGRVEIGGRYAITNQLSTYGFANYTFGSGYDATSLGIGLNYAW